MRQVCYCVAASLDGYISGPNGEIDWIVMDPEVDFAAIFNRFDTLLIGRKTHEAMQAMGEAGEGTLGGDAKPVIISRTMRPADHPDLSIVNDAESYVSELKKTPGKDIWLFGGGELFHCLLAAGLVDMVEVAIMPALVGGGIPLLPAPSVRASLSLKSHRVYKNSGIVSLEYTVNCTS